MSDPIFSKKAQEHPTTKAVVADLGRIRGVMTPYLGRLRVGLKTHTGAWNIEVMPTLTGSIDTRTRKLRPLENCNIIDRIQNYYLDMAEYERAGHRLHALPLERIGRRDILFYHLLITRMHRKTMTLHDSLITGYPAHEPRDDIEAESIQLNELWDFEVEYAPEEFDNAYPRSPRQGSVTFQ